MNCIELKINYRNNEKEKKDPDVRKVDLEVQDASDRKNVYCSELF